MSLNAYWAYGLRIHAELVCPELPPAPVGEALPDVTILLLQPIKDPLELEEGDRYEVRPGYFRLNVPGVARYRVEAGSRIFIEPLFGAPIEKIRLFLLGSTLGALLYQRGIFPLHGSAVETEWGAMVFVGAQGAGKSTLAAEFHRRGYRLLSDDVCAVAPGPSGLQILPALAKFRLCPDAFEGLGKPVGACFEVDKFVVPMGAGYCPEPVLLRAIHILMDGEDAQPQMTVLSGLQQVRRLIENLYRPQYLLGQQTQAQLMAMAAGIAGQTMVATVARRRDAAAVPALAEFLEAAWEECFSPVAA